VVIRVAGGAACVLDVVAFVCSVIAGAVGACVLMGDAFTGDMSVVLALRASHWFAFVFLV
jgi:hypothetical protein